MSDPGAVHALGLRFEALTLSKPEWTHAAHLTVGAWNVDRHGEREALARLREGIRRLNASHGTANTESSGYHETITRAYVVLIAEFLGACPKAAGLDARVAWMLSSPLGARDALLDYYAKETLMSVSARMGWVAPDRAPLAFPAAAQS